MAFEVIGSAEAQKTIHHNVNYLETEWFEKEIIQFLKQTEYVLSRIQKYLGATDHQRKQKSKTCAREQADYLF